MAETLTEQQKLAVENRGGKLLVSAAAGSGKTKVLVDRLLLYLTESQGKINIDDFLIITYTKAAASELRAKIAAKLNERLAEDPGNKHLQRQLQRLYLTKISTVHAFCADILREHAYRLDIAGDFRVAEEQECQLIQLQVIDKLLDRAFAEGDRDFLYFIDSQELGRDDFSIPKIILQVYNASRCHIDPDQWLEQCISDHDVSRFTDAAQTIWGKYLIDELHNHLCLQVKALKKCARFAEENGTMPKPAQLLQDMIRQLEVLINSHSWDDIVRNRHIDYGRLTFTKNVTDITLKERIKAIRKACKEGVEKKLKPFSDTSEQVLRDQQDCANTAKGLVDLVRQFAREYEAAKKSRRILDFSDLEHKTLDLLVGKKRQGTTALANEIADRFCEIMVDEYQDSNAVQDRIFSALTEKKQNCFMVGDVKQSIYQFRLADPGIFLDKYSRYVPAEQAKDGEGRKIMLSKNFRSAGPVVQAVNDVFSCCMSPDVGGLYYGDDEALREGRTPHITLNEPEIELCTISVQEDTYEEEAEYTANRILELTDGTHMIRDGDSLRPITAGDIVILLRSPGSVGAEFQYALEKHGIAVDSGGCTDLLQTEEVGFLRALLQIIDNPLQDIPLITVLTSRIFCFQADDLASIRSAGSRKKPFYDSLKKSENDKVIRFMAVLQELRREAKLCSLTQLLDKVMTLTRMDSIFAAFDDGAIKTSNLQAFYRLVGECENSNQKELCQFLDYLTALEEKGITVSNDKNVSGAVTIMSIHKSKGLEFPVVFLCGLSRDFNREDARAQVLCNRDLGIGLNCVDLNNRIRYPSVAKKAIAAKIISDSTSEELRVLYVAMTRAKDRLIMIYAVKNVSTDVEDIVNRLDLCDRRLLTADTSCPGTWVLITALQKMEAGALFALGGRPDKLISSEYPWQITVKEILHDSAESNMELSANEESSCMVDTEKMKQSLGFVYPHIAATSYPSKQTATQLKGRQKDQEAAENTVLPKTHFHTWRKPSFAQEESTSAASFGNTVHAIMQYIKYENCVDRSGVEAELHRLADLQIIDENSLASVDPEMIWNFFATPFGEKLRKASNVIREFKFSILDDAKYYSSDITDDQILLQGVVDCAIIDSDGITVLDFKTDRVTSDTVETVAESYKIQVQTYARALSKIFQKKVISSQLYFFRIGAFIDVI